MKKRTPERVQILTDMLTGAMEHGGHGWFSASEYRWINQGENAYAVIRDDEGGGTPYRVTLDVIARGLGVIRDAVMRVDLEHPNDGEVLHNVKSGERLGLSQKLRQEIMLVDRTNGADGDLDVIGYLAILECGLFGKVVYN